MKKSFWINTTMGCIIGKHRKTSLVIDLDKTTISMLNLIEGDVVEIKIRKIY